MRFSKSPGRFVFGRCRVECDLMVAQTATKKNTNGRDRERIRWRSTIRVWNRVGDCVAGDARGASPNGRQVNVRRHRRFSTRINFPSGKNGFTHGHSHLCRPRALGDGENAARHFEINASVWDTQSFRQWSRFASHATADELTQLEHLRRSRSARMVSRIA